MKPEDVEKRRTFPKKPNPIMPNMSSGNKFQKMASFHKEQEKSGHFYPDQRKIHFGGTPRMQYREGGKFYKPPRNEETVNDKFAKKSGKFAGKKGGKLDKSGNSFEKKKKIKKVKKVKGEPVKGTSTEYDQLANSENDDEDEAMDVSDMLPKEEPEEEEEINSEIPLINTSKKLATKKTVTPVKNRFSALGHYEDYEEEDNNEAPPSKKSKYEDSDDSDGPPEEVKESGNESGDESEDDEAERLKFREEIAQMPLGKVREMKEKLGIKLFNKTYFGTSEVDKKRQGEKKKSMNEEKGGQHRPKEISSKRPVSTHRNIYGDHEKGATKKRWDPRFDSRAGDFKEVCFENNYQFLDDIRIGEMQDLRNEYNTARGEGDEKKATRLKNTIQKMETREKTRAEKRRQAETRKELHDDNIERMLRGEAPIFRTKAQVRRIDAEKKFEELKKDNKLDKYKQRKAKKESAKQKKARPFEGYGYQK